MSEGYAYDPHLPKIRYPSDNSLMVNAPRNHMLHALLKRVAHILEADLAVLIAVGDRVVNR
jgi:hypothetical protein